ncbi:MAG: class II glutamine amidotransferase [Thermoguttaceae bacterium]|jgi:glutamine amidotransferase|nr:class II glutamine amidotransferase [Thermoguttaceae bacterium]
MTRFLSRVLLFVLLMLSIHGGPGFGCEVMGFSFNEPVSGRHLFADFRLRGHRHPDGWGVALYPDKSVQLFKEGKDSTESDLAEFLTRYEGLKSDILIAFLRSGSPGCGGPAHQNSHPFTRELHGRDFVLAHEGTIYDFRDNLKLGRARPLGINDSEFLTCYLAGCIEREGIKDWNREAFAWLDKLLHETSALGSVTCMFSDGEYLFVYLDERDRHDLYCVRREAPYGKVTFKHINKEIDLSTIYPESAKGMVFSTKPLTTENWTPLPTSSLMVLKKGEVVYATPE